MKLKDIPARQLPPEPWSEGDNIPWHEPCFSRRMLREHISQSHDMASRRYKKIDEHVDWINHNVLSAKPCKILDLACGPGLYTNRLAKLGHHCVGIDFSPASIDYARKHAISENLSCAYTHADIRSAEYGSGFGLVMLIFGELNVFKPSDANRILRKAYYALDKGGALLLEAHTGESVRRFGSRPDSWYSSESGIFSDSPHLCLQENFWDEDAGAVTRRYFIVDAASGEVSRYAQSLKAYTAEEYVGLLENTDFDSRHIRFHPSLTGIEDASQSDLLVITARK